jgi:hypothetical protein
VVFASLQASPGNVRDFEELLYRNKELEDTAVSVAICFGVEGQHKVGPLPHHIRARAPGNKRLTLYVQMVGAAFADAILRKIGYCQFVDTVHLANLEVTKQSSLWRILNPNPIELKTTAVSNSAPSRMQQSLLLQIGARECILAPGGVRDEIEMKKLDGLLERCGIMKTEVKKAHFKAQDIEQDLSRLVREDMANNLRTRSLPPFPLGVICFTYLLTL